MALIKAGTLLTIETGEYSDRTHCGPFRVLMDFDQQAIAIRYVREYKPDDDWEQKEPDPGKFAAWLVKNGFAEDVPGCLDWHVGSYGSFEPEIFG